MISEQTLSELEADVKSVFGETFVIRGKHGREDVCTLTYLASMIPTMIAEVRRLREALEFYSKKSTYLVSVANMSTKAEIDCGERARAALGRGEAE